MSEEDYYPECDPKKSWLVYKEKDGWYYYGWTGDAYGPFETEEKAQERLDDYAYDYDTRDS